MPDLRYLIGEFSWTGPRNSPEQRRQYAWHGRHHTAHITSLRGRMGW